MNGTNENLNNLPKLWIIEDDPVLLKVFISACKLKYGDSVSIVSTTDGLKAIDELKLNQFPDVVVLDLMLPGASGFQFLESLRNNEDWKKIPVVILSNLSQEEDMQRGKTLGVEEYLVKADIRMDEVMDVLAKYLKV
jgi:CheY-like chemotaxis protein